MTSADGGALRSTVGRFGRKDAHMKTHHSRSLGATLGPLSLLVLALAVAGCGEDSCVEEDTLVSTPSGDRAIGEVQVGESIWSVDPDSGAKTLGRVSRVVRAWGWCEKLDLGGESLWLTAEHPLYSPELGEFRAAQHWLEGELATTLGADGAPTSTARGAWYEQRPCRVIDLTVESEPHTFIAAGIVVHNKSFPETCEDDGDCSGNAECVGGFCEFPAGAGGSSGMAGRDGAGGAGGAGDPVSIQVVSFGDVLAAVGDPETTSQVAIPGCTRTDNSAATTDVTFDCPDPGPGDYQVSVTATGPQQAAVRVQGETQDTASLMTGQGAFLRFTLPVDVPDCRSANDCEANQVCIDETCVPGTLVFVTKDTYSGDLGGLTGADLKCAEAGRGLRSAPFFAWVSTSEGSPDTSFPKQSIPYYRVDGTKIADDWDDLTDTNLQNPINIDEDGNTLPAGSRTWTSTNDLEGVALSPNCSDHTSASSAVQGVIGDVSTTTGAWSAEGNRDCNLEFHLYCFEASSL